MGQYIYIYIKQFVYSSYSWDYIKSQAIWRIECIVLNLSFVIFEAIYGFIKKNILFFREKQNY
jgi:hypothetical protein